MILHLCDAFQKGIVRELSFSNEIKQNEQVADDVVYSVYVQRPAAGERGWKMER
jgi:hypothetical protein